MHYYVPPSPLVPVPTGTSIPEFGQAVTVAQHGATAYQSGDGSATTVENDGTTVETIIASQYGIAWTSSDPAAAVAALDRQYAVYLQNDGTASRIDNAVVAAAKGAVQGGITDQPNVQIQRDEPYNEPMSLTVDATTAKTTDEEAAGFAAEQADINAMLHAKYGAGNDRVYTAAQIEAAVAALDQQALGAAPLINFLAANIEERRALKDVLAVLRTKSLKLTPAEINSGCLGAIELTPAEIDSGILAPTPVEAQLAKIEPVTLTFLKTSDDTVTQRSPQTARLVKESPSLFACVELNALIAFHQRPFVPPGPILLNGQAVQIAGQLSVAGGSHEVTIPPADAVPAAATDESGVPPTTSGLPAVVSRLDASKAIYSGIATSFEWTKKRLEFAGCGHGAAPAGNWLCPLIAHRGIMSPGEEIQAVAAVAQGILPFVTEPIARGIGRAVNRRFGRADTRVSPTAIDLKVQPGAWRLDPEGGFLWWGADGTDGGESRA